MEKIIKYKVDFINEEFEKDVYDMINKLENICYILNKKSVTFSPIEKFIYDTCMFHCSNNNISFMDDEKYMCEFWKKSKDHATYNMHYDYDYNILNNKNINKPAYFSIITSLSDSIIPTIVTNNPDGRNITVSQPAISFILPEKNTQILFEGSYFMHGSIPFMKEHIYHERNVLVINMWKEHVPPAHMYDPFPLYKNTYDVSMRTVKFQQKILNSLRFDLLDRESYDNLINTYKKASIRVDTEHGIKLLEPFYKVIKPHITSSCDVYTVYYPIYKNYLRIDNLYKLVLINVASDANHIGYKNYVHMLHKYGIRYKTLGLNKSWNGGDVENGTGGGYKINLLKEELSTWDINTLDSTILLFTDSYDVLINSTENNILNRYYEAMTKYKKHNCLLFSAEKECWPDTSIEYKYPNNDSPYLYLNSGGFIGTAHNVYSLIRDATISNTDDDQLFFTNIYLNDHLKERIILDHKCYLFQTLNESIPDIEFHSKHIIQNIIFNTYPLVIHGNGPEQYKQIIYTMFYIIKHNLYKVKYEGNYLFTPMNMHDMLYKYGIEVRGHT